MVQDLNKQRISCKKATSHKWHKGVESRARDKKVRPWTGPCDLIRKWQWLRSPYSYSVDLGIVFPAQVYGLCFPSSAHASVSLWYFTTAMKWACILCNLLLSEPIIVMSFIHTTKRQLYLTIMCTLACIRIMDSVHLLWRVWHLTMHMAVCCITVQIVLIVVCTRGSKLVQSGYTADVISIVLC